MGRHFHSPKAGAQRGAATVFAAVTVVGLGAMSLGLLAMNLSVEKEQRGRQRVLTSFYAAEAGLSAGYQSLLNGGDGTVASEENPEVFGSAEFYVVPEDLGGDQTSLICVASVDGAVSRAELVVRRVPNGQFQHGGFGHSGVTLGSSSFVDSYDSTVGSYASQVGPLGHANEKGHVGSNADLLLEIDTEVYGDASPGVTGVLDDNALIVTGSTAPLESSVAMPPITVPVLPALPSISTLPTGTLIPPGQYHFPSIMVNVGHTLTITGPAVVVVDDLETRNSSNLVIDATLGPVEIYGTGSFELKSTSSITTHANSALDVSVKLTGDNYGDGADGSVITMSSGSFTGTIYAPNAELVLPSAFQVYGAVMSDVLNLASNASLHYDEALAFGAPGTPPAFETLLWRPVGGQ